MAHKNIIAGTGAHKQGARDTELTTMKLMRIHTGTKNDEWL